MKVGVKLTTDNLHYLNSFFENLGTTSTAQFVNLELDRKVVVSILIDVADKVSPMARKVSRDLFNAKKKHSLSLKFYQGYALWVLLTGAVANETDPHRKLMAGQIHALLDPKMS